VRVFDPGGFWRGESLTRLGCDRAAVEPDWIAGLDGSGSSARDAVAQVLDAFESLSTSQGRSATYTAQPGNIGYSGAKTQTWVAAKNGRAHMTIDVTRTHDGYRALPSHLCTDDPGFTP